MNRKRNARLTILGPSPVNPIAYTLENGLDIQTKNVWLNYLFEIFG